MGRRFVYPVRMYTQCPHCRSIYRLKVETLARAQGELLCGHCSTRFNALATLTETLPGDAVDRLPLHRREASAPLVAMPAYQPLPDVGVPVERPVAPLRPAKLGYSEPELEAAGVLPRDDWRELGPRRKIAAPARVEPQLTAPSPEPSFSARERDQESFGDDHSRRRRDTRPRRSVLPLAIVVLGLALLAQSAYLWRAHWWPMPLAQRVIDSVAAYGGWSVPRPFVPDGFALLGHDSRPDSTNSSMWIVTATLRNQSPITLDVPNIRLRISDAQGRLLGERLFTPAEFLADAQTVTMGVAPDSNIPLRFELADPGEAARGFEFAALPPDRLPTWLR